ncbi:MAG: undecaprenyl-diphosphate phosphatase [Leptospiraceae bacterium]|nr:undecaprenyl-diphosphate phosphatase [Leptospiraceae bacterium]
MNLENWFIIFVRSVIEALTEFLPISSTGHLFLFSSFFPFSNMPNSAEFDDLFDIFIQTGAMLSVLVIYKDELISKFKLGLNRLRNLTEDNTGINFWTNIVLGSVPVLIVGFLFKKKLDLLKSGDSLLIILGTAWVLGGIVFLIVERYAKFNNDQKSFSWKESLLIGIVQCIALIPGVSRSAATIITARLLGSDKKSSLEFSFFVAIPVLTAAGLYKLFKYRHILNMENLILLSVGFFLTFIFCLYVIRFFLHYIRTRSFVIFGYYRIALGIAVLFYAVSVKN